MSLAERRDPVTPSNLIESARRAAMVSAVAALMLATTGCVRHEVVHYTPLTWDLDGKSELHISSYPSWFPKETSSVPFLHKTVRTPESIYFQVFIREAGTRAGANPHLRSILIRSFTYQLAGRPAVQLIADYDQNFWAQDQAGSRRDKSEPVPCLPGQPIRVSIALEVNGVEYAQQGEMSCAVRERTGLLLAHALAG